MIQLLFSGHIDLFVILLVTIVFSLTLHEFGHAASAKLLGDDTAERAGRLTLNPWAHIDPAGLLMVMFVGFGWARPVPINPGGLRQKWGAAVVAGAGPFMNLVLAFVAVNLYALIAFKGSLHASEVIVRALAVTAQINLLLMLFNLIPLGPLDGHYIFSWLLPRDVATRYDYFNMRYGSYIFLSLIVLSFLGVPIFRVLSSLSEALIPALLVV